MGFLVAEEYLPAILTVPPMTDAEFAELCAEHRDLNLEMTADGDLIVMAPAFSLNGARNSQIAAQLGEWADRDGRGICLDSSAGFVLPNGARRSPDASWVLKERLRTSNEAQLNGFWHLCPDFLIELRSSTDRLRVSRNKMTEWVENGAQLAWLIDPENRTIEIYQPGAEPQLLNDPVSVAGRGLLEGFELEMARVWNPLD